MKVVVAGSRTIHDVDTIFDAMRDSKFEITEVVCGMAEGVDLVGKSIAEELDLPVKEFPAHWYDPITEIFNKAAAFIRNRAMAEYGDALIAVWDGKSKGTLHMIECMRKLNKPVEIINVSSKEIL